MNKCKYIITLSDGSLLEIPSVKVAGGFEDFKDSLLNWSLNLSSEEDIKSTVTKLSNIDKKLVVPEEIKGIVIGQNSINNLKLKIQKNRTNLSHIKKIAKALNIDTKENIVFAALPDEINYQYLPESNIILVNNAKQVNEGNIIKGILESIVSKNVESDISPKLLLRTADPDVLNFLKIPSKDFTLDDLLSLYFDESFLSDSNIVETMSKNKENWKEIQSKFSPLADVSVRSENYGLKDSYQVYDLNPGDLILTQNKDTEKPYYSIFLDYFINGEGNYVVESIAPNSTFPEKHIYPFLNVIARKVSSTPKFNDYIIENGGYVETILPPNDEDNGIYSKNKFLINNLKRGDKIAVATSTRKNAKTEEYEVLNIKGSQITISDGKAFILQNPNLVQKVLLNKAYHPELSFTESQVVKFTEESLHGKDKEIINENDVVEYETKTGIYKGLVLAHLNNLLIVKNLSTNIVENVGTSYVNKLFINDSINKSYELQFSTDINSKERINNPVELVNFALNFDTQYINTDYSIAPYYRSLLTVPGDYIVNDNKAYVIVSDRRFLVRVYDGTNYVYLDKNSLNNAHLVTKRAQDPKLISKSLDKNSFYISIDSNKYSTAIEVEVMNTKDKGLLFVKKGDPKYLDTSKYINITKEYKEEKGFGNSSIYSFKNEKGIYVKDSSGLIPIKTTVENLSEAFPRIFPNIVVGSSIRFGDLKYWLVEKKIKNNLLISYSYLENGSTKTIKKLIDANTQNVKELYLPFFAKNMQAKIISTLNNSTDILQNPDSNIKTSKELNILSNYDSPELILAMSSILEDKFKIKVNFIHNSELENFSDIEEINDLRAFVKNGEYYINIDKASIAEPLHELLHMVLASMKYSDPENYMKLVSSIESHPLFGEVSKNYLEVKSDLLEETFIRLFSDTVRRKILNSGVFNTETFMNSIKASITEMFDLKDSLEGESAYNLLDIDVRDILANFSSTILEDFDSVYNKDNALVMMSISTKLREFIKDGKLKEQCNG